MRSFASVFGRSMQFLCDLIFKFHYLDIPKFWQTKKIHKFRDFVRNRHHIKCICISYFIMSDFHIDYSPRRTLIFQMYSTGLHHIIKWDSFGTCLLQKNNITGKTIPS